VEAPGHAARNDAKRLRHRCGGKNILPVFLLSFVVPSLAISLRRE
jgi:hypothetical protein